MNNLLVTLATPPRYSFGVMKCGKVPDAEPREKNDGYYGVVGMATWKASR